MVNFLCCLLMWIWIFEFVVVCLKNCSIFEIVWFLLVENEKMLLDDRYLGWLLEIIRFLCEWFVVGWICIVNLSGVFVFLLLLINLMILMWWWWLVLKVVVFLIFELIVVCCLEGVIFVCWFIILKELSLMVCLCLSFVMMKK